MTTGSSLAASPNQETPKPNHIWDFGPIGMWWEIKKSTVETNGESFEAINVIAPGFANPPLHIHPTAEESYSVISGTLDVCFNGQWRKVRPGEAVSVPAGVPHTLRNESETEVRIYNIHKPALDFERFFRRFQALATSGQMKLPSKDFRSAILISMLFAEHPSEIISVKPPRMVMILLALLGRLLGYRLPQ